MRLTGVFFPEWVIISEQLHIQSYLSSENSSRMDAEVEETSGNPGCRSHNHWFCLQGLFMVGRSGVKKVLKGRGAWEVKGCTILLPTTCFSSNICHISMLFLQIHIWILNPVCSSQTIQPYFYQSTKHVVSSVVECQASNFWSTVMFIDREHGAHTPSTYTQQ